MLTVLLIVNDFTWVIGQTAVDLQRVLGSEITFLYFSTSRLRAAGIDGQSELASLVQQSDVVHVLDPSLFKYVPAFPFDRPTVAPVYHVIDWDEERANLRADAVFVISEEWAARVRDDEGVEASLLRFGVDTSFWTPSRRPHGRPSADAFRIGFFSNPATNVEDRKGVGLLLEALREVAARLAPRRVELVLSGFGWEPFLPSIRASGVDVESAAFLGRRQLRQLYRSLDTYVVAASVEGGPATLIEAMACGVVPVSTRVGVAPELIEDGVSGYLIDVGDGAALVDRLLLVAGRTTAQLAALGRRARWRAETEFDMRTTFAAAPALYERARATFAGRAAPPVVAPLDIDPAVQRAEVEFEDRLQHLLLRAHAPMASVDLLPQLAAVLRRRPARGLAMALRWSKMEAVSRSPALRGIARRRSRRDQAPADT